MWAGMEADLIPTEPGSAGPVKSKSKRAKDPKVPVFVLRTSAIGHFVLQNAVLVLVWLAGGLIVRCENQGLQSLPPQLFLKTTLRKLIVTGNALTYLPEEIQQLRDLRELKLGYNQLQVLPDGLCTLQQLEHMDVQRNQLEAVPVGLCRLVHLSILNLDGNPLSSSISGSGPALHVLWPTPTAGGSADEGTAGPTWQPSSRQAAEATLMRLKQGTEVIMQHLLQQQDPQTVLNIKQAKLKLLQEASARRISKLVTVADPDSLATCLQIATSTGLSMAMVTRIQQSQAAAQLLQQALQRAQLLKKQGNEGRSSPAGADAGDTLHQQLAAAIRRFEELCKPGRPSGPVYVQAHAFWRMLQRQQLERGWRCKSPASPVSAPSDLPAASIDNGAVSSPDMAASRRRYLTLTERRRQELEAVGAQTYDEWCSNKQKASARERQRWQDVARLDSKAKVAQVRERAARAVGNCSRENAWPSKVVEAYPAGTFNRAPQQLKAIRKHYQKPPQNGPDEGQ